MITLSQKFFPPIFAMLLFVSLSLPAFSQGWQWQNPKPTGHILNNVQFINATTGWAVGSYGTILHTTDGGANWTVQNSGTNYWLSDVVFLDANTGWAVGDTILHTTNGGATWVGQTLGFGIWPWLTKAVFTDANNGWAVGGVTQDTTVWIENPLILHTTNGGNTWTRQGSIFPGRLYGVAITDSHTVWAVGYYHNDSLNTYPGLICHSTDAGATWNIQLLDSVNNGYQGVAFVDSNHGWMFGYDSTVLHTTNGGMNWERQTLDGDSANELVNISFTDANHAWIVGRGMSGSVVARTTDGGTNWSYRHIYGEHMYGGVSFANENDGWLVSFYGLIQHTTDGGTTWLTQTHGTTDYLTNVICVDENNAWANGNGQDGYGREYWYTLLHTTNGGTSWEEEPGGRENDIASVSFVNSTAGWAAGDWWNDSTNSYEYAILHTTDGGNSWNRQTFISSYSTVKFVDLNNGWAAGWDGSLYRTTNGGTTWEPQTGGVRSQLIVFTDANHGWLVEQDYNTGHTYHVRRTTDAGETWAQVLNTSADQFDIKGLHFIDNNHGWLVGHDNSDSRILQTTDGGTTWTTQYSEAHWWLENITFADANNGWAIGGQLVLHTTDGGTTWSAQDPQGSLFLAAVAFANASTGWMAGDGGSILHTTDGGATFVANTPQAQLPNRFVLEQNYPNPFNARTLISYALPIAGKVSLEVFDVTGRKVATLVNGYQPSSRYRVPFDASKLATGVYFYRLSVNGVSESRKMILLK